MKENVKGKSILVEDDWHLRVGVTANCNFRCLYCNPRGLKNISSSLNKKEISQILQAAYNCGIRRAHWTGGEPTVRQDFIELIKAAKDIGFTEQIVTTNGYKLYKILDVLIKNGLTRVIVSLDTLNPKHNKFITGRKYFYQTLKSIEESVKKLSSLTKISAVTMKSTLAELKHFIHYAQKINSKGYRGKLAIKLNQFFPSNPAQLSPEGQEFWKEELVSYKEIIKTLKSIGPLKPFSREKVAGDNPSYRYFLIGDPEIIVGILALFSWKYPCGRCHKLRIQPDGSPSICLNLPKNSTLIGKSIREKTKILRNLISFRETRLDKLRPDRKHYRPQLGEMRFGKLGEPVSADFFYKISKKEKIVKNDL